ncbi:MAG TPA: sigma-70 family RNA polymerase sigma factor [bacterium]|nr:sigma-70 family RNA polymerase sigma factor [bacterium]
MNTQDKNTLRDEDLVKEVQNHNDMYAFEILVKRYQSKIYNTCYRFMGDTQEAFDCAQDTFVKIYTSIRSFKYLSSFATWAYRIAVNTCKNRLMSWEYRRTRKTRYLSQDTLELKDNSISPAQDTERSRIQEKVQEAINMLPFDQKQVIILRDIQQLSYEEIEKITGLRSGTVKSKIARGRDKLKEILKDLKYEM